MNAREKELAKRVMTNLIDRPGARSFIIKPVLGDDFDEDYFKTVKEPTDLETVRSDLEDGKYATVDHWKRAVNLCFDNALLYYEDGPLCDLAEELRSVFVVEYRALEVREADGWEREVSRLLTKIGKLNDKPPSTGVFQFGGVDRDRNISEQLLTKNEMKALSTAVGKMKKPEDYAELEDMIRKQEPGLMFAAKGPLHVDLVALKASTLVAVRSFVQARLTDNGISYPGSARV